MIVKFTKQYRVIDSYSVETDSLEEAIGIARASEFGNVEDDKIDWIDYHITCQDEADWIYLNESDLSKDGGIELDEWNNPDY